MKSSVGGRSGRVLAAVLLTGVLAACGGAGAGLAPPGRHCPTAVAGADRSASGPVFYVSDPGGCGADAYDYAGAPTGSSGGVTVRGAGDGQVVWQSGGTFNRALSAPGLATIA